MTTSGLTWEIARAGGFVAYGLLTASVAIGLVLSLKWRSPRWTRFITNELHRFVTLLALIFTVIHTLMVAIDPFIQFSPAEILIPFISHYRPLWIALGIVAMDQCEDEDREGEVVEATPPAVADVRPDPFADIHRDEEVHRHDPQGDP